MMTGKRRIALVGCGKIGERHAALISTKAELVAVCDISKSKADAFADKYQARAYYSLQELLAKENLCDAVSICTPNGLHAQHSIDCLNAGVHVLCEKPMALNVEDCQAMINASTASNKILAIVKQNRFNPPVQSVKALLDSGHLGSVHGIHVNCFWNRDSNYYLQSDWRGTKALDGGILFTQFSHFVDILNWFGGELKSAETYLSNFYHGGSIEFEDTGSAILYFKNGTIGSINFTINAFKENIEGSVTIMAEKGSIKIGGAYLNKIDFQSLDNTTLTNIAESEPANNYGAYSGSMSNHHLVYDNFLMAMENNDSSLTVSAKDGLRTVQMIRTIYDSAVWVGNNNFVN